MPRLVIASVFSTGGRPSSPRWDAGFRSAQHHAHLVALVEGVDAEAPDARPRRSRSCTRGSRTRRPACVHHVEHQRDCCGVSGLVIGLILPSTFIDAGMPAVMNRSDPLGAPSAWRNEARNRVAPRRSAAGRAASPNNLSGVFARLLACLDHAATHQLAGFGPASACPRLPVWIDEYICATLSSRIRLRMAGVPTMISCAATRPPPTFFSSACEITATQRLRQHRTHHRLLAGGEHVDDAVDGLRGAESGVQGANTRWPVSAAVSARADGFKVAHLADQDDSPGLRAGPSAARSQTTRHGCPTSRWLIRHFLEVCTNRRVFHRQHVAVFRLFRWLTMAASVVDLPEPVGPVTSRARAAILVEGVDAETRRADPR